MLLLAVCYLRLHRRLLRLRLRFHMYHRFRLILVFRLHRPLLRQLRFLCQLHIKLQDMLRIVLDHMVAKQTVCQFLRLTLIMLHYHFKVRLQLRHDAAPTSYRHSNELPSPYYRSASRSVTTSLSC